MASAKRTSNEATPPPDSADRREFLKEQERMRREQEAAAAERRRRAASREAASSDAKLEQAAKDKEQAMKDKQMREAAERARRMPMFRKGGKVRKMAEGGASTDKPERKSSGFKDLLGTLSPLYGMMSGKGLFGKNDIGALPALARRARKRRADGSEMTEAEEATEGGAPPTMRRGGAVKKYASGGSVSSASKRADGCATKGKTRGKFV